MPVFESVRKVQVFGSSLAVTLPALFVKACEIEKGSVMNVVYGLNGILVASSVSEPERLMKRLSEIIIKLEEMIKDQDLNEDKKISVEINYKIVIIIKSIYSTNVTTEKYWPHIGYIYAD